MDSESFPVDGELMEPTRVLIVDDHPVFLHGLTSVFDAAGSLTVVGQASSGQAAIDMAADLQPDVVVMDLHMPGMDGIAATREIVSTSPHIAVLVLTMSGDDESVFAAMRVGARGYLLKGTDQDDIVHAVEAIAGGTAVFGGAIAQKIIDYFTGPQRAPSAAFPELTDREREILTLIADGHSNPAIAKRLYLSPKTVRNHVSNIFAKLQVAGRAEAIARAQRARLGGD